MQVRDSVTDSLIQIIGAKFKDSSTVLYQSVLGSTTSTSKIHAFAYANQDRIDIRASIAVVDIFLSANGLELESEPAF